MTSPGDDEALSWEGDEPARSAGHPASASSTDRGPALPEGFAAVGKGADGVGRVEADGSVTVPGDRRPTSNAVLVTIGVLGGVYLLSAVGWLVGGLRLLPVSQFLVTPAGGSTPPLWQSGTVFAVALAVAAPMVWFAATFVLTRGARASVRIVVLVVGALLLVPWPFVSVGVVGA